MKRVAIIFNNRENEKAITHIRDAIMRILEGFVEISTYYFDELKPHEKIEADAYLLNGTNMLYTIKQHVDDLGGIIRLPGSRRDPSRRPGQFCDPGPGSLHCPR